MRAVYVVCIATHIAGCASSSEQPARSEAAVTERALSTMTLEDVAAEYRRLRPVPIRLGLSTRDRDAERKVDALHVLGDRLGAGTPKARVVALLGAPDETARPGDELWAYAKHDAAATATELLVYDVLPRHTFLWFLVADDVVVATDWFRARER
jgi:hypothetical protein